MKVTDEKCRTRICLDVSRIRDTEYYSSSTHAPRNEEKLACGDVPDVPVGGGEEESDGGEREVDNVEEELLGGGEGGGEGEPQADQHAQRQEEAGGGPELEGVAEGEHVPPAPHDAAVDGNLGKREYKKFINVSYASERELIKFRVIPHHRR